jgi:hypothetical protein
MQVITTEEKTARTADEYVAREHEVAEYQNNIDRYTNIVYLLPKGSLPDRLKPYYSMTPASIPNKISIQDILLIESHREVEDMTTLIRSESIQQAKAMRIRDVVYNELPVNVDEKDKVIKEAILRRSEVLLSQKVL